MEKKIRLATTRQIKRKRTKDTEAKQKTHRDTEAEFKQTSKQKRKGEENKRPISRR